MTFAGAVLCGGRSRRMGVDKALVEIDGLPMATRVAEALAAAGAAPVLAIGGDRDGLRDAGLVTRPDTWPGEGPLGGLVTALEAVDGVHTVVVLACDLVAPDPALVAALAEHRARTGADALVPVAGGRWQWGHAAWRRDAAGELRTSFEAGERSLAGAAQVLEVVPFEVEDVRRVADADRPADLPRGGAGGSIAYDPDVDIPQIDIEDLASALDEGAPLFDVRQPDEYDEAHVPDVRLVPLAEVPDRVDEFPTEDTVFVICRSGGRSAKAVQFLRDRGVDAVNVRGGMLAWLDADKPVDTGA